MSRDDLCGARWRKSSYSDGQANCVQVAAGVNGYGRVAVRDSKSPDGPVLTFAPDAWHQFTEHLTEAHQGL